MSREERREAKRLRHSSKGSPQDREDVFAIRAFWVLVVVVLVAGAGGLAFLPGVGF